MYYYTTKEKKFVSKTIMITDCHVIQFNNLELHK